MNASDALCAAIERAVTAIDVPPYSIARIEHMRKRGEGRRFRATRSPRHRYVFLALAALLLVLPIAAYATRDGSLKDLFRASMRTLGFPLSQEESVTSRIVHAKVVTMEEARSRAQFRIITPEPLPHNLKLKSVESVDDRGDHFNLIYSVSGKAKDATFMLQEAGHMMLPATINGKAFFVENGLGGGRPKLIYLTPRDVWSVDKKTFILVPFDGGLSARERDSIRRSMHAIVFRPVGTTKTTAPKHDRPK